MKTFISKYRVQVGFKLISGQFIFNLIFQQFKIDMFIKIENSCIIMVYYLYIGNHKTGNACRKSSSLLEPSG